MKSSNSYGLIHIGLIVRLLSNLKENYDGEFVTNHFDKLEHELNNSNLSVSLSALLNFEYLVKKRKELKIEKTKLIGEDDSNLINEQMAILEKIIFSESITKYIYVLSERRFNGEYLNNSPQKLLKENVFGNLSDMAKFDFAASCRCLLFGEATACAFHILRATEDTLKQFYFKYKKTNRLSKPMWGPMTNELRTKKGKKPSENILSALDLVRISYRNPTQHPEAVYDIDSCQDLFGVCIDLINKMAIEL